MNSWRYRRRTEGSFYCSEYHGCHEGVENRTSVLTERTWMKQKWQGKATGK